MILKCCFCSSLYVPHGVYRTPSQCCDPCWSYINAAVRREREKELVRAAASQTPQQPGVRDQLAEYRVAQLGCVGEGPIEATKRLAGVAFRPAARTGIK